MSIPNLILVVGLMIGASIVQAGVARFIIEFKRPGVWKTYLIEFISVGLLAWPVLSDWRPAVLIVLSLMFGTWFAALYYFDIHPWLLKLKGSAIEHQQNTQPEIRLVPNTTNEGVDIWA